MAETPVDAGGHCAQCSAPTSKSCGGCNEGASFVDDADKTYYCGPACQKADWNKHKPTCKRLKAHKSLHQGVDLLRRLWLILRAHTYPSDLDKIVVEGEKVTVFETVSGATYVSPGPFAHSLFTDDKVKEMVMNFMACGDAMTNMRELTRTILMGICDRFEEVTLSAKCPWPRVTLFNRKGKHDTYHKIRTMEMAAGNPFCWQHCIFRVRLKNTIEFFAVDFTGAQYGHFDIVVPWEKYTQDRVQFVLRIDPWGTTSDRVATAMPHLFTESNVRYEDMIDFTARRLGFLVETWMAENKLTATELIDLKTSTIKEKIAEIEAHATNGLAETQKLAKKCGDLLITSQHESRRDMRRLLLEARKEGFKRAGIPL